MIDGKAFMNDGFGNAPEVSPRYPRGFERLWNEERDFLRDKNMSGGNGGGDGSAYSSYGWSPTPFSVQEAMNRSRDKYLKAQKWLDKKVAEDTKPFLPSILFGLKPPLDVDRAIFSPPATIVYWTDGTKTVVKCDPDDTYSKEAGIAFCFMKKSLGNKGNYNQVLKRLIEQD